jgi:hypothetical protein
MKIIIFDDEDATTDFVREHLLKQFKDDISKGNIRLIPKSDFSNIFTLSKPPDPILDNKNMSIEQIEILEKNNKKDKPWKSKNYKKKFKL